MLEIIYSTIRKKDISRSFSFFRDSRLYFGIFGEDESYILYRKQHVLKACAESFKDLIGREIKMLENLVVKKNKLNVKKINKYENEVQIESIKKKSISLVQKKKKRKISAIENDLLKLRDAYR